MSTNGTSPEQLEADIARQREELATTIDELHAKLDVKTRLTETVDRNRPQFAAAAAVMVALTVGLLVWRRRH